MDLLQFQFHSYFTTLKFQLIHAWHHCPKTGQTCFQKYLLYLVGSLKLIQYFFESMLLVKKINRNLLYVKLHRIHLFFGFQVFLALHETPHLEIPIFHYMDSLEIMRFISIHISCIINNIKVIFAKFNSTFLDFSLNFGLNIGFVHSISCACKILFIVF